MTGRHHATEVFHNRIALVFDFDRTLSSGTIDALLQRMGVEDSRRWREDRLEPMVDSGWDEILAKAWLLARTAEERGVDLTEDFVRDVGRSLESYPGVEQTFEKLREKGAEASGGAKVEIYVLSSGFVDMITASPLARCVDGIWGSSLHWDEDGKLQGVKRTVMPLGEGPLSKSARKGSRHRRSQRAPGRLSP